MQYCVTFLSLSPVVMRFHTRTLMAVLNQPCPWWTLLVKQHSIATCSVTIRIIVTLDGLKDYVVVAGQPCFTLESRSRDNFLISHPSSAVLS